MIRETTGNIFTADVEALVNPVNIEGAMGAGLALQFKEHYPRMFRDYQTACAGGGVQVGRVWLWESGFTHPRQPKWVVCFPTKQRWRDPSRLEWIDDGLRDLRQVICIVGMRSVAVPALGCGLGGLDWGDVRPLIWDHLGVLPDVDVVVHVRL